MGVLRAPNKRAKAHNGESYMKTLVFALVLISQYSMATSYEIKNPYEKSYLVKAKTSGEEVTNAMIELKAKCQAKLRENGLELTKLDVIDSTKQADLITAVCSGI
jgi:hypothetical protein